MYIKEVCLEGFKSYATRTVVHGFDPFFNAITGLNGSGKSNILDSICFVLGITNLQQVRASNIQELVYKQGQAGITKATVSVVFDNSDKDKSPPGYQSFPQITVTRQIVVGGRNTYLINGHKARPKQVHDFFQSVKLNVNNPHFLIIQGRITKVLNMKPPEILSMLEEAVGTRMYETKKNSALKILEEKQGRVDEINKLLDYEIHPRLEKLRKERMQYMEWCNGNVELDRLKRFCIAYEFIQTEKVRDDAVHGVNEIKKKICEIDNDKETMQTKLQEMDANVSKLTVEKDATTCGEVKRLTDKVDAVSRDLGKEESLLKSQEDTLTTKKKNVEKIEKSIEELEQSAENKANALKTAEIGVTDLKKRVEELAKSLEEHKKEHQAVDAGKSNGNEAKSCKDQLRDAKVAVGKVETEVEQLKTNIIHSEKELRDKKVKLLSKRDEAVSVENELRIKQKDVEDAERALKSLSYNEGHMEGLRKAREVEAQAVDTLKEEICSISLPLRNIEIIYRDHAKNFDKSKIKGVVAKLIKVNDSSIMTALEVCAGGKLYNIVVDNEKTGKQIIDNSYLKERATFIPLNKVERNRVQPGVQNAAANLVGKGNAEIALSLVGYDDKFQECLSYGVIILPQLTLQFPFCRAKQSHNMSAMEYVFGGTFVCKTKDVAQKIVRQLNIRSVTLEGDLYQPNGLLTGGSRKDGCKLLRRLHALAEAESKLSLHQKRLSDIEANINELLPTYKKYNDLTTQLQKVSYKLSLFKSSVEKKEHHKLSERVKRIEQELAKAESAFIEKQALYRKCVTEVENIEKSVHDHDNNKDLRLLMLEKKIKEVKTFMESAIKDLERHENEKEKLITEAEAHKQQHDSKENQLVSLQKEIIILTSQVDALKTKITSMRDGQGRAQSKLKEVCTKINECDSKISCIHKEQQKLENRIGERNLERKKLESEVKRMEKEQTECSLKVHKLIEHNSWITSEKQFFGISGSDYDFTSCDPHKEKDQFGKLQAQQARLEKRVNKKVMTMFERAEDEYNDMISKKNIIENDKSKIKTLIKELDEKKKETLKQTWVKVNSDFGSIFSTLLPGTMAKLEPTEGGSFLDGLEVRVAFGGVWKQSLSELSGGQRSLLTLSLILALLIYNPAPVYILDEVDSALDLSNTQNIGRMIKAHFPHSQFIIVSLKEGMLKNANVLFRTKFENGVSAVERTVASKA